jgi:hypothetical protein
MGGLTRLAASCPGQREGRGGALSISKAAAMARDKEAVAEARARAILLRLRLDFSLAWMTKNNPHAEDMLTRLLQGLRRAGAPEE